MPPVGLKNDYPSPTAFRGIGKKVCKEGYSDHFPIATTVTIN